MIGCWGTFVGLFPPAFLQDEVDALDRRDVALGGALAIGCVIVLLVVIPTMTSTIVSAWTDRASMPKGSILRRTDRRWRSRPGVRR